MRINAIGYPKRVGPFLLAIVVLVGPFASLSLAQETDDEDEPLYRPGLIGQYAGGGGTKATKLDRTMSFNWRNAPPDRRLPSGKFTARWQGLLQTEGAGEYRLYVFASGKIKIDLNGETVLRGQTDQPAWVASKRLELPFGYYPLDIQFEKTEDNARLTLYWTGPQFQLEPIGERQLVHRRENSLDVRFERGEQLVRALKCAACHTIGGEPDPLAAPDLSHLRDNVSRAWLVDWLAAAGHEQPSPQPSPKGRGSLRRMPAFGLSRDDATAIAAWLWKSSQPAEPGKEKLGAREAGETLFLTTGCLACHQIGELGESGLFGGGDLSHVGDKRPAEFFARWLAEPARVNKQHRMPVFELSARERADLAAYLSELRAESKPKAPPLPADEAALAARGKALVQQHRCQACHAPEELTKEPPKKLPLSAKSQWEVACVGEPDVLKPRPGYRLSSADATAVKEFISAMSQVDKPAAPEMDGRYILAERNCVACHARDASPGLAPKLPAVGEARGDLTPLVPAMTPPPLASVGDKLHDAALEAAITRKSGVHRPWLRVRMPKFEMSAAELQTVVRHLIDADRIPERPPEEKPAPLTAEVLHAAGARLVTTDGFGCTSCHQLGKALPPQASLNARGADLSLVGQRIRKAWFDRWVRNPSRIVPRMEMPSVQTPVRGVLEERLDDQLSAVWHVLNESGFEPPLPNPVRVARRSGIEKRKERALVLTDVLTRDKQTWIKPLVIGLPNRHSGLFDLSANRLAGWWVGDTARQRTLGKTWFWEPANRDLLQSGIEGSEVLLVRDGKALEPLVVGQFPTELDSWEHAPDGVEFRRRLYFASGKEQPHLITVTETWSAFWFLENLDASGWMRDIEFNGVPPGTSIEFRVVARDRIATDVRDEGGWSLELKGPGESRIEIDMDHDGQADRTGSVLLQGDEVESTRLNLKLDYITKLPVDLFPLELPPLPVPEPVNLDVVPGYEAVRLPLADDIMPTGLTWRPNGTLAIASLKGQVWLAKDTTGDGLEDKLAAFSDDLAAPYGLLAENDHIDVITKYAMLRLRDDDGDGRADRTETLASGWGHTADYHDWVIGIERDKQGNRYVAIPCEQDKRSPAAAHLRGRVVKLIPREPTESDPRRYRLEEISAGHRFPMGLARSRSGEMFVTDNQGNYNPFNELNHVVPGARYGFINALEKAADFKDPPLPAAIEIPHPWTRSVNGICFLDTPAPVGNALRGVPSGKKTFGPFEGHLIGCEYDTRRLIRMSLERVGDTYQGACYPFTYDTPREGQSLLGPLVCAVSPSGDLYVGCVRDSGWGGANNIGAVTRLRPLADKLPAGIAEARATKNGFVLDFTKEVDPKLAADASNYFVASYRRISTPAYGGPDVDRRAEKIVKVAISPDARQATLELSELREGFVYEIRLKNLAGKKQTFHPAEAYYTLRKAPR